MKVWELLQCCDAEDLVDTAHGYFPKWKYSTVENMSNLLGEIMSCTVVCAPGGTQVGTLYRDAMSEPDFVPVMKWADGSGTGHGTSTLYWSEWLGLNIEDRLLWSFGAVRLAVIIL